MPGRQVIRQSSMRSLEESQQIVPWMELWREECLREAEFFLLRATLQVGVGVTPQWSSCFILASQPAPAQALNIPEPRPVHPDPLIRSTSKRTAEAEHNYKKPRLQAIGHPPSPRTPPK